MTQAIFTLPFVGKDAAYEMLKAETYNWRRLLLDLGLRLFCVFNRLTSNERESVLIIDAALQCVGLSKNKLVIV